MGIVGKAAAEIALCRMLSRNRPPVQEIRIPSNCPNFN